MLKILLLISFLCYSFAEEQQTTVIGAVSADDNKDIRAFAVATNPTDGSITVAGFRSTRNDDGKFDFNATLEGAAFKFRACNKGCDLSYYYGAAALSVKFDWTKDGTIGKVDAAVCEVAFGVSTICVYEEHDGNSGFQYKVGDKLVCPPDSGKDCLVDGSCIPTSNINFDLVSCTQDACPAAAGYDDSCTVYTCTSQGTWTCTPIVDAGCPLNPQPYVIFEATTYFASQLVKIGNYEVGPYISKTTWQITPPWDSPTFSKVNASNARVVAVAYAAGKSASIEKTAIASDDGLAFAISGKTTYFSYAPTATVDSTDSTTYSTTVPADDVINGDSTDLATKVILGIWKIILSVWKGFGWSVEVIFFSWDENKPTVVIYDPSYGQTGNVDGSSALGMAPGLMLPLFISIFQYFYRIF